MKNQVTLSFLLFIGSLVLGYSISSTFYHSDQVDFSDAAHVMKTRSSDSIPSMNNGQRSVLLIGVDSTDTFKAQLVSLWLVTNLPSDSTLRMLPIFPAGDKTISDIGRQLHRSFDIAPENGQMALNQDFIKVLEENNYWWSGYIIFDHVALTTMLDLLGGVEVNGKTIPAYQAIQEYPNVIKDPLTAFSTQLAIVQTACHRLTGLSRNPDWSPVISLIPTHLLTDLDIPQLVLEWETLFSSKHSPNCRFPTLEISMIDN